MICSDVAPPYIGGGESYVIDLGSRLVKLGHEVYWLTARLPKTKKQEIYQGIAIHRVPILFSEKYLFPGRQTFPFCAPNPAIKLARGMDILQFDTFIAGTFGWFVGKVVNKPSLLFCHEMFNELWQLIGLSLFEKNVYPLVEKYIARSPYSWFACPSEYSKQSLIKAGAPEGKITVIPHGIDLQSFNKEVSGKRLRKKFNLERHKLLGYTGRLSIKTGQSKNLINLLKATDYVVKENPEVRLVLGGRGFQEMVPLIRHLGLEPYVIYLGQRPGNEVPEFMAACDIIVCPALSDGFCFLLAEASACGKPVVATNLGAHSERVMNGKTGVLTDPSPQALAEGIIKVLGDEELAERLGGNGEKYARKFNWENSVNKHLDVYNSIQKVDKAN